MIEKRASGMDRYRSAIRSAIYGLWRGAIDRGQFLDVMGAAIDRFLRFAFAEGAAACGIKPPDYSDQERQALRDFQAKEYMHILNLADAVEEGSKANGGKREPLYQRAELWILRYQDVMNQARTLACADGKFRWELGATKEHCSTCSRLAGQVRRGSFWRSHVLPQNPPNPKLECEGWNCRCELVPTDEPCSRGRLPRTP